MNRFLLIPLAVCVFAFGAVYFAIASSPVSSEPAPYAAKVTNPEPASPQWASFDQASTQILDGWPIRDRHAAMSRVMVFQPLYAKLGPLAKNWPEDRSNFLASLELVTLEKQYEYPINFDRLTNEVHIFADNAWQPYKDWRELNQPLLEKNVLALGTRGLRGSLLGPQKDILDMN